MTFEEWWNTKDYPDCCLLRCKRAFNEGRAELEKENLVLHRMNRKRLDLQKERVQLKEKIEVLECDNYNANCNLNLITDQLTKAKEIIRQFLNDYPVITKELLDKIEQFIKEIEK